MRPWVRFECQPQCSNPSLKVQIPALRLKSYQNPALRLKLQPRGSNPSLEAQTLALMLKSQPPRLKSQQFHSIVLIFLKKFNFLSNCLTNLDEILHRYFTYSSGAGSQYRCRWVGRGILPPTTPHPTPNTQTYTKVPKTLVFPLFNLMTITD